MRLGYLGPSGTHSQAAAEAFANRFLTGVFPEGVTLLPMMSLHHLLSSVEECGLHLACIPIENALEGSVAEVLDSLTLKLTQTTIAAEFVRPIQHALIRKFEFMEGIAFVHSHPQAIGQCRDSLYDLLGPDVKFVPAPSTSEAVKALLTLDETHAALGTLKAAEQYGLDVLIENIGNQTQNETRFLVIVPQDSPLLTMPWCDPAISRKTSLCIGLHANKPGALLGILTRLADHGLNMSKIESRPTKKSLGEYLFYLDIEGPIDPSVEADIREHTSFFKCLGVYPVLGSLV